MRLIILYIVYLSFLFCNGISFLIPLTLNIAPKHTKLHETTEKIDSIQLSDMVENMEVSKTIAIHALTKELEKQGQVIYSLCVGEPDYDPPIESIKATCDAAKNGLTKYTAVNGDGLLREAIAKDLLLRKNTKYTADQIVVSNGAKQAVYQALLAVINPGDAVIIPKPYWPSYPDMVKMCHATPIFLETFPNQDYMISPLMLRDLLNIHPNIRGIILCNPSNPTGGVANRANLEELASVLEDFPKVTVISDEIYERLTYGVDHTSFASIPEMYSRTIVINGFSKSHSMTGYRIGYAAAPIPVAKACIKLQSQITSCASSIGQYVALKSLTDTPEDWFTSRIEELKLKRDLASRLLANIPHVTCPKADGAFYLLPDVSYYYNRKTSNGVLIRDSNDLCFELLRSEQVALVPGDAFGAPNCIRISYAASEAMISESLTRLMRFLVSIV